MNSMVSGLLLGLVAIGFAYIFRVTKVFHLAHGAVLISGAFSCWWMHALTHSWIAAISFSIVIVSALIFLLEKLVYLPLRNKNSNESISLIASSGAYVILVNLVALLFGNENKIYDIVYSEPFDYHGIIITSSQIVQFIAGAGILAIFIFFLRVTKINLSLQALSDDDTLAKVLGINTHKQRLLIFLTGSILACCAGILKSLEVGLSPHDGMSITLSAAVVAILIGRLNALLVLICSIFLVVLQNSIEWFLNAQWRDGITFFLLLIVILFRTEGIISYNLRKDRA